MENQDMAVEEGDAMADKATIIVHSGDMDKVYSALIIANGALAMGMEASLYFTFWGLQRLKKGGLDKGPLSRMNMLGLGKRMMKQKMKAKGVASVKELREMCLEAEVKLIACQMTVDLFDMDPSEFIDGIDYAGAATFFEFAGESDVNLFV